MAKVGTVSQGEHRFDAPAGTAKLPSMGTYRGQTAVDGLCGGGGPLDHSPRRSPARPIETCPSEPAPHVGCCSEGDRASRPEYGHLAQSMGEGVGTQAVAEDDGVDLMHHHSQGGQDRSAKRGSKGAPFGLCFGREPHAPPLVFI